MSAPSDPLAVDLTPTTAVTDPGLANGTVEEASTTPAEATEAIPAASNGHVAPTEDAPSNTAEPAASNTTTGTVPSLSEKTGNVDDVPPSDGIVRTPFPAPLPTSAPPPPQPLSPEQKAKYEEVLDVVSAWTVIPTTSAKNAPTAPITEDERMWLTRECILRYLRAVKWSAAEAPKRLLATLTWRREYGLKDHTADYISVENETGKQIILGYDNAGRPCLYLRPGHQNTNTPVRQIQHLVYMMERTIDLMPPGQGTLALVLSFKESKGGSGVSISLGRQTLHILQSHYPERLGSAVVTDIPWAVWGFLKILSPFIDPLTREKLKFNEDPRKYIPPSQLWTDRGGDVTFEYDHSIYWPALTRMAAERRHAYQERWVKGGKLVGRSRDGLYEPELAEDEREAVRDLLQFLENRNDTDFFSGEPLRALSTLVYSDNISLQRSASLTFAEVTERDVRVVDRDTLEPILSLLASSDVEVQRAASAALGNLAVDTDNKVAIVLLGGLPPLIKQMMSPNVEVQCNAVGCITNLATHEENKAKIARSGALGPLTRLAKSKDMRVQRNATGALLNMTHSDENRQQLVNAGAIPVLVQLLSSSDVDVQYYCTTALSNIAVDQANRKKLAASENRLIHSLVHLMDSTSPKVQCQAALALRNLASDEKYQLEIVKARGLTPLLRLLSSSYLPLILSAVACIRNISIHPQNESPIIEAGFLKPLVDLLGSTDNEEIQCHAISTLRNLAASSDRNKQLVLEAGAVQKCKQLVLDLPISVQSEMTAAIAVLALSEELKSHLLSLGIFDVLIPLTDSSSIEVQGNSAAALGNLSSKVGDYSIFIQDWTEPNGGIHGYLQRFLASGDPTFQHIAIWTLLQLLESEDKKLIDLIAKSEEMVQMIRTISDKTIESDDEDGEDGEGEVVNLARRSLELLGKNDRRHIEA
ncbi:MAG: Vacuolar protein 8 [Thelocarpon superellum]|nr:MAG: Vacuolar protein 8 [Thelocarpon superellum]